MLEENSRLKENIQEEKYLIYELKERIWRNDEIYKDLIQINKEIKEYQSQLTAVKVLNKAIKSNEYIEYSNRLKNKEDILNNKEFRTYIKDKEKSLFLDMIQEAQENIQVLIKKLKSNEINIDVNKNNISKRQKENEQILNKFEEEQIKERQKNISLTDFEIQQIQNQLNEMLNPKPKVKYHDWDLER